MTSARGYAVKSPKAELVPFTFERRAPRAGDVEISISHAGICHSDIHQGREEWGQALFPMVPGHEIVGRVKSVGSDVQTFKPGDLVGVGVFIDSCRNCDNCKAGLQQWPFGLLAMTIRYRFIIIWSAAPKSLKLVRKTCE